MVSLVSAEGTRLRKFQPARVSLGRAFCWKCRKLAHATPRRRPGGASQKSLRRKRGSSAQGKHISGDSTSTPRRYAQSKNGKAPPRPHFSIDLRFGVRNPRVGGAKPLYAQKLRKGGGNLEEGGGAERSGAERQRRALGGAGPRLLSIADQVGACWGCAQCVAVRRPAARIAARVRRR